MIRTTLATTVLCLGGLSLAAGPTTKPATPATPATPAAAPATAAAPKPPANVSKYPVIVHVVSRDRTVTVSSGPKGLVYSLAMNDGGKILVADASGEEFAKQQPELYSAIRGTIAVKNPTGFLWDGVSSRDSSHGDEPLALDASAADASR